MNKTVGFGIVILVAASGCFRQYPNLLEDGQYGHFEMSGDAAGMREAGTMFAGMIREGKAPDDAATTPYWNHRMDQEKALTIQKLSNPTQPGIGKMIKDFLTGSQTASQGAVITGEKTK